MSRQLKFRAWDKYNHTYLVAYEGDFIRWHAPSNYKDHFIIEQFTGLSDKNGVDIYEGDVIRDRVFCFDCISQNGSHKDSLPELRVVVWDDYDLGFGWGYADKEMTGHPSGLCLGKKIAEERFEVIGNIHQNPELMEVSG